MDGSTHPASARSASGSRFKFTPKAWRRNSSAPPRGGVAPAGFAAAAAALDGGAPEGNSGSDSDGTDTLDDDSDTDDDVDDDEEEDEEEDEHGDTDDNGEEEGESEGSARRSSAEAGAAAAAVAARAEYGRNSDECGDRVMWVLKSGEEAKLEGMDMTRNLRLRVGFAPVDGCSSCRFVWRPPRAG